MSGVILGVISYECFIENKNGIKTLETVNPKKKGTLGLIKILLVLSKKALNKLQDSKISK